MSKRNVTQTNVVQAIEAAVSEPRAIDALGALAFINGFLRASNEPEIAKALDKLLEKVRS